MEIGRSKVAWKTNGLWTDVDPSHLAEGTVAEFDLVAGPSGSNLELPLKVPSTSISFQNYVGVRTWGLDAGLLQHVEINTPRKDHKLDHRYSHPNEVRWHARDHRLPILHLPLDHRLSTAPEDTPPGDAGMDDLEDFWRSNMGVIALAGHVGRNNGLLTVDPDTNQEYRLSFQGSFAPQRYANAPSARLGEGHVALFWKPSAIKSGVRADQIMSGIIDPDKL